MPATRSVTLRPAGATRMLASLIALLVGLLLDLDCWLMVPDPALTAVQAAASAGVADGTRFDC